MPDDYKNTEGMRLRRLLLLFTLTSLSIALLWYGFDSSRSLSFWTPKAMQSWREVAAAKREGELAKIPKEWRLDHATIEEAAKLRAIAGPFIESLLDDETLRITRLDPLELTECTGNGSLSAYSVVKAFCKRAAYGHQLVRTPGPLVCLCLLLQRATIFWKSVLTLLSVELATSTSTTASTAELSAHCRVYQSR